MDSFGPTALSSSPFAFAQAGTFLFQFNLETDKSVFADPDLLPELRNLRLTHSLIREALEKNLDEESPIWSDLIEDLALYTDAVRRCNAIAQHLRLQSDPSFLKDPRVVTRQVELLQKVRQARRCSEKLQYRLDEDASLTTRLDVASEDIQNWLDASLGPSNFNLKPSGSPGFSFNSNLLRRWIISDRKLMWCTSTSNDSGESLGLAIAYNLARPSRDRFVGHTPFTHPSRQLELVEPLCQLLRQFLVSQEDQLSVVLKGWFLSHKDTRPSLEDVQRILLNELRKKESVYMVFSGTTTSKDDLETFLPIFQDLLQIGCRILVISPFSLPAQLDEVGGIQVTEAAFQSVSHVDRHQGYFTRPMTASEDEPLFFPLESRPVDPEEDLQSLKPFGRYYRELLGPQFYREHEEIQNERDQWGAMLSKLTSDTAPVAKISVKMLVWLAFSSAELTLDEIRAATADGPHRPAVTSGTNPLERLKYFLASDQSTRGNEAVYLRTVFMRWFLRQRLRDAKGIHTDGPHALIAEQCLSYIGSVFNLGKLPEDDNELEEWIGRYPLLRYAGKCWGEHASKVILASDQHTNQLATLLEPRHVEELCALMLSRSEGAAKRHKGAYKGMTGLHLASAFGLVNVVSQMIGFRKFNPCLRTDDGWTALHWAVERSHQDVVTLLLTLPDTESLLACRTGSGGCTALHFAVKHRHSLMVEAILKTKANVNARDSWGRTALYFAVWSGLEHIVEQLLSSGADPNIPSIYGTTLHCAVKRGTPALVRTLISASGSRIDLNIKDILPLTALEEAQTRGRDDVVAILLEAGAKPSLDLIITQGYILDSHRGLSSIEGWRAYEVDLELSARVRIGNQCTCHVLRTRKQEPRHAEDQETLELGSEEDLAVPTRVFRKTFDLTGESQGQVQKYLLSEWQLLFKLRHPHIVRYIDSDEDPHRNEFLLYMEYCDKGDLETFHGIQLKNLTAKENKWYGFVENETTSKPRPLTGVEVWAMIWQIASALAYLHYGLAIKHKKGLYNASLEGRWAYVIHRDVKPANIVMHSAGKNKFLFKLCDLGIASPAGLGPDQNQTQLIGSSGLQPPEVRQGELWTTRGDMFSLGETIRLTAKLKDELLNCQAFKSFLDGSRGIVEDERLTSLEAMEIAYGNLRKAPGSFSDLPRAVVEEMRSVHQVLGRWGGSYLLQSFLLTAELLDNPQPFQQGSPVEDRKNLVKRLWLLLNDGAEETFTGKYELPAHLLILLEGRSAEEKLSRKQALDRVSKNPANVNHQWVKSGWSALHIAAQEGSLMAVKTLLRHEVEVDLKDKHGMTAKHYASENGLAEIVALLDQAEKATFEQQGEVRGNTRKRMRLM